MIPGHTQLFQTYIINVGKELEGKHLQCLHVLFNIHKAKINFTKKRSQSFTVNILFKYKIKLSVAVLFFMTIRVRLAILYHIISLRGISIHLHFSKIIVYIYSGISQRPNLLTVTA